MRASEFVINIPITISLNSDGEPSVTAGTGQDFQQPVSRPQPQQVRVPQPMDLQEPELDQNPVMVTPQQQELELKKAALGKISPVIAKLLASSDLGADKQ